MSNGDFDQMRQFGQMWLEMLSRSGSLFGQVKLGDPPPEAAKQIRGAVFKSMADQAEQFMRSETFLQGMKQSIDAALNFQKQYQTTLTEFRHSTEGVASADIDATMMMLRQMESRVLDRLEDLDATAQGDRRAAGPAGNWTRKRRGASHELKPTTASPRSMPTGPTGSWRNRCRISGGCRGCRSSGNRPSACARARPPSEVVYEQGKHRLLHYTCGDGVRFRTPLLFVFALVNRPYILDLKPGKSVVEHFVRRGFDTYLIDWGVPTDADRSSDTRRLYQRLDAERGGFPARAMRRAAGERPGLLHGRIDERDVHGAASGIRAKPDSSCRRHRLQRRRRPAAEMDQTGILRRGRPGRCLRKHSAAISAIRFSHAQTDPEPV